jgi:hypothetical protein
MVSEMTLKIEPFLKSIEEFGFKRVLELPFISRLVRHADDIFYIYFHKRYGIFLQFDTFNGESINSGHYYYQWYSPKDGHHSWNSSLSSGGYTDVDGRLIWSGYGDCRFDMIVKIFNLAKDGKFITPWVKTDKIMIPTFIHYGDHDVHGKGWDASYKAYERALEIISPERYALLPKSVKDAICKNLPDSRMVKIEG